MTLPRVGNGSGADDRRFVVPGFIRLLKNDLRCHRCVENSLVRQPGQNAHLPGVNGAFSPVFALRWLLRPCFSMACYTPERPGSSAVSALGRQAVMVRD
ncbi:hypothetical protein [Pseudomonas sp. KCJK8993]|uniref:hypothetical protein n=1 Tax=Pseudomonas sp. KCJK8993 TaxID=3344565 RepID=UPI0039063591